MAGVLSILSVLEVLVLLLLSVLLVPLVSLSEPLACASLACASLRALATSSMNRWSLVANWMCHVAG